MKKILLILFSSIMASVIEVAAYESPLQEGYKWELEVWRTVCGSYSWESETFTVLNDTVVDGHFCKNILYQTDEATDTIFAYVEDEEVYVKGYPGPAEFLSVWDMKDSQFTPFTMNIMGIERQINSMRMLADYEYFIDGIAPVYGTYWAHPQRPTCASARHYLQKAWDGDKLIFDIDQFEAEVTAIEFVGVDSEEELGTLYDLRGIKVKNPQKGTIYVTSRGQKIVWK